MEISIQSFEGKEHGKVTLEPELFSYPFRLDIVSRVINWQNAKRQAGTHATKGISQISGTTKKPYKQKGTGNARQGSLRSPQFRGGATIFGPLSRSHAHSLPKQIRRLGLRVALSHKVANSTLHVFNSLELPQIKLKPMAEAMEKHNIPNALFVGLKNEGENLCRSIQNLAGFDFLPVEGLNVLDIIKKDHVIISLACLSLLKERLS